jgi:signal peptidase I
MSRDARDGDGKTKAKTAPSEPQAPPTRLARLWHEWVRPLLVVGIVLLSFRSSLADWNDVPSGSMKPTILEGDRVFVNKLAYNLNFPFSSWSLAHWADPQRGDIVVLWSPYDGKRLVKRVVAVPGDTLEVRRHRLVINGQPAAYEPLPPDYLSQAGITEPERELRAVETVAGRSHAVMANSGDVSRASFGPVRLPEGKYFLMGDHRDDSFDSRFFGFVDRWRIVGRATTVVLSLDINHGWRPRWSRFFKRLK